MEGETYWKSVTSIHNQDSTKVCSKHGTRRGCTTSKRIIYFFWGLKQDPQILCRNRQRIRKSLWNHWFQRDFGPSSAARTHGLLVPNQARYQLRYTRIFNFCHYTTAGEKIKDFSVCGHLCGQSRFYAVFGNRRKPRKRRRRKALRRFTLPCPGYRHGTPKPGAIPASLYPDIQLLPLYHGEGRKAKLFLAAVIYVHNTYWTSEKSYEGYGLMW